MKKLLFLLFLLPVTCMATNIYFDATAGSDGGAGTIGSPYKTITKLNTLFASMSNGDSVLFKRGETFYGEIVCNHSYIKFGAYGSGAKPIISGFYTIPTWTNISGNIWESTAAVSTLTTCNIASINGTNYSMARLPKSGYYTIGTTNGSTTITDASHISTSVITANIGAFVAIRELMYEINNRLITNVSGNTITYTAGSPTRTTPVGWGYILMNDQKLISQAGEWAYNSSTKKLSVYSVGTPSGIKVPALETGVDLNGEDNCSFTNIQFQGFNTTGINTTSQNNITVTGCDFSFIGTNAINGYGNSADLIVTGSTFTDIGSRGIWAASSDRALIQNNACTRVGHYAGMGSNGDDSYTAIIANGDNSQVLNNTIINAGYCGIRWDGAQTLVQGNFVDTTNYVKDDGGGIYSYQVQYGNNQHDWGAQRVIRDNIVLNAIGAAAGSTEGAQGFGYYFDGQACNFNVLHNTTANNSKAGIFVNGGARFNIDSNTVYNSSRQLYVLKIGGNIDDISVNYNTLTAKETTQYAAYYEPGATTMPVSFSANNNCYARPIADNTSIWYDANGTNNYVTLSQWKASAFAGGEDAASTKAFKAVSTTNDLLFVYNATGSTVNKALPAKYANVNGGSAYNGMITLAPYSSAVLVKTGNIVLPTRYKFLKASVDGKKFMWQTLEEDRTAYFVVQESGNAGRTWKSIAQVKAVGPSTYTVTR